MDSPAGRCGAPLERRVQLMILAIMQLAARVTNKKTMQSLLGSFVHPFSHNKLCMSTLGKSYQWVAQLRERQVVRIPARIRDEILAAALHLPLAWSDLRAPVSTRVHYSDATPTTGGFVVADVSRELAEVLWNHSEFRGRHTRLDWQETDYQVRGWVDHVLPD